MLFTRLELSYRTRNAFYGDPQVILDYLHEVCFHKCGLGRTILGPPENVRSLTRQHLQDYITTHYTAPRMVVVGAGALEHDRLVEMADQCFGRLPSHPPQGAIVTVREEDAIGRVCFQKFCWILNQHSTSIDRLFYDYALEYLVVENVDGHDMLVVGLICAYLHLFP